MAHQPLTSAIHDNLNWRPLPLHAPLQTLVLRKGRRRGQRFANLATRERPLTRHSVFLELNSVPQPPSCSKSESQGPLPEDYVSRELWSEAPTPVVEEPPLFWPILKYLLQMGIPLISTLHWSATAHSSPDAAPNGEMRE